jgi:hypothetical protein
MLKTLLKAGSAISKASKTGKVKDVVRAAHSAVAVAEKVGGSSKKGKCSEKMQSQGKCKAKK